MARGDEHRRFHRTGRGPGASVESAVQLPFYMSAFLLIAKETRGPTVSRWRSWGCNHA